MWCKKIGYLVMLTEIFGNVMTQKDVFLICTNAMQYNAPDTIYFRQVCSKLLAVKLLFL